MSRFEDTLHRDLTVIADRATPSPDAWATIQQRIADQDPIQETEIIMLTENTTPTRRWPLVAAAAAVIALIIGAVALVGTDDDGVPADDPTPTVAPTPPPDDDAVPIDDAEPTDDTDAGPAVVQTEEPAADEQADAEPSADEPATDDPATDGRELTLTGDLSGSFRFTDPGSNVTSGATLTGDALGQSTTEIAATENGDDGPTGSSSSVFDLRIDGVGEGRLIVDEQFSTTPTGAAEFRGVVIAGTGDLLGATGTWTYSGADDADNPGTTTTETFGTYTLDLALPPAADVERGWIVRSDGSIVLGGDVETSNEFAPIEDAPPGTESYTTETVGSWSTTTGYGHVITPRADIDLGIGRLVQELDLDGVGSGTIEWLGRWDRDEVLVNRQWAIGGTGDFVGYRGRLTGYGNGDGTEWDDWSTLTPGPGFTKVTATGTWTNDGYAETPRENGTTFDTTATTRYEGDMTGTGTGVGFRTPHEDGRGSTGGNAVTFTGEIAGLGEGTLTTEERFSVTGPFSVVGVITGGTGDFAGARGTMQSTASTYRFDVEVPIEEVDPDRAVELSATWTDSGAVTSTGPDGEPFSTGITTFAGQLNGEAAWVATNDPEQDGIVVGSGDFGFTGTIEGVGSGTLTMRDVWRHHPASGRWVNAMLITDGTGDFTGATGWMLGRSADGAASGTTEVELRLPAG